MTLTSAPTFPQPNFYNNYNSNYPQSNPPPYSDYDQQLRYLSSSQMMVDDSGYWDNSRNEAVRMLNGQTDSYVVYSRIYSILNSHFS